MTICIYHGNCADGFTAAWVVSCYESTFIEFHAAKYGEAPPNVDGKNVFIVDFSYPREVLIDMAATAMHITILDHHKTAEAALAGLDLPNVTTVFDTHRSGARITWDHLFPNEEPPKLLRIVEDRDLWRKAIDGTDEVMAAVFSYPYDFGVWTMLMDLDTEELREDGQAILRKQQKEVREILEATRGKMLIGGWTVPAANMPYTMASDAGEIMSEGAPFAAVYWDTPRGRQFSLRSRENGVDVSEVARAFGGGGHCHAAGFRVPHDHELAGARPVAAA